MIKQNISRFIHSRLLRFLWLAGLFYLVLLTLFRVVFHIIFTPAGEQNLFTSFLLGFRYDARIVGVFLLIILLLGTIRFFKPFTNTVSRRILFTFCHVFNFLLLFFYTVDFAHFAYLRQRLNASVLSYMDDAGISMSMVWESYPVIKIFLGWIILFTGLLFAVRFLYRLSGKNLTPTVKRKTIIINYVISFFAFAFIIWGRIGQYP
ncbi:MAG: hypothetical protein HOP10_13905, partial [Chitinophagaceae bacterium]|nr:hypothetical protein [Chitinophagaceae bacterium]